MTDTSHLIRKSVVKIVLGLLRACYYCLEIGSLPTQEQTRMLRTKLIHPTISQALAASGHGGMILIADGNYPFSTRSNPNAEHVYLNLMPGMVKVTDALEAILTAIPVEAVHVMQPDASVRQEPGIWADFRRMIPDLALQPVERFAFYEMARRPDVALVVATGDQRLYANIMLTIGVVPPEKAE
jgi:L-fucose mutarotase